MIFFEICKFFFGKFEKNCTENKVFLGFLCKIFITIMVLFIVICFVANLSNYLECLILEKAHQIHFRAIQNQNLPYCGVPNQ